MLTRYYYPNIEPKGSRQKKGEELNGFATKEK